MSIHTAFELFCALMVLRKVTSIQPPLDYVYDKASYTPWTFLSVNSLCLKCASVIILQCIKIKDLKFENFQNNLLKKTFTG